MFSEERRTRLIASLKKDPVPVSEVFFETVADIRADMGTLELRNESVDTQDRELLNEMDNLYSTIHLTDANKAIDIMEVVFALRDKYDALRFGTAVVV